MSFKTGAIVAGATILLTGALTPLFIENIDQGHRGVIYNRNGGVQENTLGEGWNFVSPMMRVTEYPVATTTVTEGNMTLASGDGKPITVDLSYNYHIDQEELSYVFKKFKGVSADVIESSFIKTRLKEAAQSVTSDYVIMDIFGEKRNDISIKVNEAFTKDLAQHGIVIESFTLGTPVLDDATRQAIQAKVDAQQKLEQEKIDLEKAKIIAERQRVEAQGNADKVMIEAQGTAKANELLKKSITPELVQYEYIKKWDGKEPTTKVGGSGGVMVNIPPTTESK